MIQISRQVLENIKEKTYSYHHNMGHYKSVFKDKYTDWFFFQRVDIPDITGYPPKRHRGFIDFMITKKAMLYDIKNNVHLEY